MATSLCNIAVYSTSNSVRECSHDICINEFITIGSIVLSVLQNTIVGPYIPTEYLDMIRAESKYAFPGNMN